MKVGICVVSAAAVKSELERVSWWLCREDNKYSAAG